MTEKLVLELLGLVLYPWPAYINLFHAKGLQAYLVDYYEKNPPWVRGSLNWIGGPYYPWVARLTGMCFLFLWLFICWDLLRYLPIMRH